MSKDKEKISKERATETLRDLVTAWLEESEFLSGYCLVPLSLLKEVESKGTWGTTHIACCPICKGFKNSQIVGRPVKHDPTCALGKAIKGG